ncbi:MAG: TRAP transporter small permease [Alphaproteobacteria bacterium]
MYDVLSRTADLIARSMALIGGAVLILLVIMTCISITGRALVPFGLGPIKGDFEWIEIGIGFAIFAFLPWCQLQRAHAAVDLFKPAFPETMNRVIDLVVDILMAVVAVIIAWRLYLGMLDKQSYAETTFILQFPVWQAFLAGLVGAIAFVIVAVFCVLRSGRTMLGLGRDEDRHVQS